MNKPAENNITAVFITKNGMGEAPSELSLLLLKNYLTLLKSENRVPSYICLYADGVKTACTGSPVINEFKVLETAGSKIFICKTCLNFYNLSNNLEVGNPGTMLDIMDIHHHSKLLINL